MCAMYYVYPCEKLSVCWCSPSGCESHYEIFPHSSLNMCEMYDVVFPYVVRKIIANKTTKKVQILNIHKYSHPRALNLAFQRDYSIYTAIMILLVNPHRCFYLLFLIRPCLRTAWACTDCAWFDISPIHFVTLVVLGYYVHTVLKI